MKPLSVILAAAAVVAAVFAWSVHRRNAQILAEAELWAVAGADDDPRRRSTDGDADSARPDSWLSGTPRDAMPDGPPLG